MLNNNREVLNDNKWVKRLWSEYVIPNMKWEGKKHFSWIDDNALVFVSLENYQE